MTEQRAIPKPSYTQQPNVIYDVWMRELSGSEYKVVSVIARKTFGYHKEQDAISISQLCEMSGLAKNTVIDACTSLINKGYITATKQEDDKVNLTTVYAFVFSDEGGSAEIEPPRSAKIELGGSAEIEPTKENKQIKEKKTTLQPVVADAIPLPEMPASQDDKVIKLSTDEFTAYNDYLISEFKLLEHKLRMKWYNMLIGRSTKDKQFKSNPVLLPELQSFVNWYKSTTSLSLPGYDKLSNWILKYRETAIEQTSAPRSIRTVRL